MAITETGYPAAPFSVGDVSFNGNEEKQALFYRMLFHEACKNKKVKFITNFAGRDLTYYMENLRRSAEEDPPFISRELVDFFQYFEFTGIFDAEGNAREATSVWQDVFSLPWFSEMDYATSSITMTSH